MYMYGTLGNSKCLNYPAAIMDILNILAPFNIVTTKMRYVAVKKTLCSEICQKSRPSSFPLFFYFKFSTD